MKNYIYKAWQIHRIKSVGVFFILLQSFLFSTTYYVDQNDPNATDTGQCSQSEPCVTIQEAVYRTLYDGDIVIVSTGYYIENVIIEKGITLQSEDLNYPATIDGSSATDELGSCINVRGDESGSNRGTVTVEGMILRGGRGTTVKIKGNDGFYDENDPSDKIVVGGGIRSQNVNLVSRKNKMVDNGTSANIDEGGGAYSGDAPDIDQNDPRTPTSKNDNDSREEIIIRFEETEFTGNKALSGGAGVFVGNSSDLTNLSLNFDHVTVADNYGGGIYATNYINYDAITVTNSILWGNNPSSFDIETDGAGPNIIFIYNDIDQHSEDQGNMNSDPLFANPLEGDFTLQQGSPCIDAGDPDSGSDPDGTPPDMGAYYYDQGTHDCNEGYVVDCDGSGECCPESWIGDGFADCEDQAYGCDLTCYGCDEGDCPQSQCLECETGDANADGMLNILDVVMMVNCYFTGECNTCMDINYDGNMDILDIVQLINIILQGQ